MFTSSRPTLQIAPSLPDLPPTLPGCPLSRRPLFTLPPHVFLAPRVTAPRTIVILIDTARTPRYAPTVHLLVLARTGHGRTLLTLNVSRSTASRLSGNRLSLFGKAHRLEDEGAKAKALEDFVERMFPGRWAELRPVGSQELKATSVLRMPIVEGSAKIRTGPPKDDKEDYTWPVWAGVLPVHSVLAAPIPDERLPEAIRKPEYLTNLTHLGVQQSK